MRKVSMIVLLIVMIPVGFLIYFDGESIEEDRISNIGGFSTQNNDFSFSVLEIGDEEEDTMTQIILTNDIRKSLTQSLKRQHAEKNPSNEHPTVFVGSLTFTDNNGMFSKVQFYKDESNHTYINFPMNLENNDKYYKLTTGHFPDFFLRLGEVDEYK